MMSWRLVSAVSVGKRVKLCYVGYHERMTLRYYIQLRGYEG